MSHSVRYSYALRSLLVQWWWWCAWMLLLAVLHPLGAPISTLATAEFAWIAGECVLLQMIPLLMAILWCILHPVSAERCGPWLFVLMPLWLAMDVLVYRGSGLHLASGEFFALAREHFPRLIAFLSWGMAAPLVVIVAYLLVAMMLSKLLTRLVMKHEHARRAWNGLVCLALVVMAVGAPRWVSQGYAQRLMVRSAHPTRHPLNAFDFRLHRSAAAGGLSPAKESAKPFVYDRHRFAEQVAARLRQMRMNVVVEPPADSEPAVRPDVVIIICESLRSEMLHPDVMPNAHQAASSGWWLRQHYSGGNATSLGMYSILSGLESLWFYKSEARFAPALNRLFRQAGYELGFFAGHDDWRAFQMDAFLSPDQFDRYEVEPMQWLASDRRSIAKTLQFLDRAAPPATRLPRLAVLFLYSTHAPFAVADAQAHDRPAASADYPIPFPDSSRESVWHRYRNAARTLDAELAEVLQRDAIVVLVGDHGESFLDDATIGHGTKLSRAQTRTAAMISGPMFSSREIRERTMHVDVLPTLLAAAGVEVSQPDQFDGLNLGSATQYQLRSQVFSISNLIGRDLVVIPPAGRDSGAVLGTRVEVSIMDETIIPRGRIDGRGDLTGPPDIGLLHQWVQRVVR